jgi:membrane associated rhomboid family serine protease
MGPRLTPLAKGVMIGVLVAYVLQLILESWLQIPVTEILAFSPFRAGQFPLFWQPLTYPLVQGDPRDLLWQELALFFFFSPIEEMFGRKGVLKLALGTTLAGALAGQVFWMVGLASSPMPALGLGCFITGIVVAWALSMPNANILAYFLVPVRAVWFAYGSLLLAFLMFLRYRSVGTAADLGAWAAGYAFFSVRWGVPRGIKRTYLKYRERKLKKQLGFDVIEGGAGQPERPEQPPDDRVH